MKLALLLPGYLDSPETPYMMIFEKRLVELGYTVERLDPCKLWKTGEIENYNATNYFKTIENTLNKYDNESLDEVILIGHSLGGFVSIIAGNRLPQVTKVVALCAPPTLEGAEKQWDESGFSISRRPMPNLPGEYRTFKIPISTIKDTQQYSALEEIKTLNKPVMIFIALNDKTVPPEATEHLISAAKNSYAVRQKGMGHNFIYSEGECELVFEHVREFLELN